MRFDRRPVGGAPLRNEQLLADCRPYRMDEPGLARCGWQLAGVQEACGALTLASALVGEATGTLPPANPAGAW
ncbi:hypothetical protein XaclCFBP3371_14325 [Xanthomonas euvesicatoria pv. citrumelonis]|uniref:Uncharacterized protein n=1 Tax=Xanthomonas euvesicatoria pv. vesicatoria (strain 85-10) TaxID=316273 RepID=Q3BYG3_XANE5|nr:hypothetical protein BJD11_20525 [Xanthomonas euvesicatoria]PPU87901.1 hypothetical protein XaclCFBP3371_14325 [Xanthomonas euvesicatoria pv. citrumelonis]CAJ22100.1 hypothetical protein XCV0469 [Xanthomonas euvesicatoria pv. vesicatoria str. 85-10]